MAAARRSRIQKHWPRIFDMNGDRDLVAEFWARIDVKRRGDCWNWKGALSRGYGVIDYKLPGGRMRSVRAHRQSYEMHFGKIPDGLLIRHKCDNRACCNPSHLETGTIADNNRDMVERDRSARGERHVCAKLNEQLVIRLRRERPGTNEIQRISRELSILPESINKAIRGTTWKYLSRRGQDFDQSVHFRTVVSKNHATDDEGTNH